MRRSDFIHKLAYGVGMAFSASCFTAMGALVGHAGGLSPWALAASFVLMLVIVAAVAELSALFPSALGLRTYIKAGVGDAASLVAVVLYLVLVLIVAGIELRIFIDLVTPLWPALSAPLLTAALFAVIVGTQLLGLRVSSVVQTTLVVLLLTAVVALVATAFASPLPEQSTLPSNDFASAVVVGLFLFASVEWITTLQVRHPADARGVPTVLLVACITLMLLFLGITQAVVRLAAAGMPVDPAMPQRAMSAALAAPWGAGLLLLVTASALLSTCHAGLTCASRLVYVLAREGHLPRALCRTNSAGVPSAAIAAVAVACFLAVESMRRLPTAHGAAEAGALAICTVYVFYLVSAARLRGSARQPMWPVVRLPRSVLWGAAALLIGVMAATCQDAWHHGRLIWALMPWTVAGLGVGVMHWRQQRQTSAVDRSLTSLKRIS